MKSHKYKRICKLGKGSFGDVQLIENADSKKLYALKRLDLSNNELPSVLNEVCLLQQLDHPNIIKYHEYFKENSKFCIVMEYADNGDLYGQVYEAKKNRIHISETTILGWFTQLCLALSYLHKRHVIHRDIKLQNIFLNKEGIIKLGDFGVSKKLENTDDLAKTSLGTPYYISPEICQGKPYNNKSDVWMLGCVLYELCTLERAFNAYSLHTLVKKIVEEGHQKIVNKYSVFLKNLIDEMLSKDPEKRPKVCEILERKEIKMEVKNLLEKYPKIYGKFIEIKEEKVRRDNKSISFHDYLIKKRNSLAEEDQTEASFIANKEKIDSLNTSNSTKNINNTKHEYFNLMTKKNGQNKLVTLNFQNTTSIHSPTSILSRKISLPNEINQEKNEIIENCYNENITVKHKNDLNLPYQAYFTNNDKITKNKSQFKLNQPSNIKQNIENPSMISKPAAFQIKTPQHNYEKRTFGYPIKKVINLNLDESIYLNPEKNLTDRASQLDSSRIEENTSEQNNHDYNHQKNSIKPLISISPKYISKDLYTFKAENKENLPYLANQNKIILKTEIQESIDKDKSFFDLNVSFDEFSKKKNQNNEFITDSVGKDNSVEPTKRSISMHMSNNEAKENFNNPNKKFTKFSEFLKRKQGEKIQKQSFVSFLEKQKLQNSCGEDNKNFCNLMRNSKNKKELIQKCLPKNGNDKNMEFFLKMLLDSDSIKLKEEHFKKLEFLSKEESFQEILVLLKEILKAPNKTSLIS